jgi:hypothetical protein
VLDTVVAILCGLLLLADFFAGLKGFNRAVRALRPLATVIGMVAIVIGILEIVSVLGILLVLSGFILAANALSSVPKIGAKLGKAGRALDSARVVVGILVLAVGVMSLLD